MKVVPTEAGRLAVTDDAGSTLATFSTNREAWAFLDRRTAHDGTVAGDSGEAVGP